MSRDEFFDRQTKIIKECGWAVVHVVPTAGDPDDAVPFAYTVGLTEHDHPELVIAGLAPALGHQFLNELAIQVHDGHFRPRPGRAVHNLFDDRTVLLVAGPATTELLFAGSALARYGYSRVRLMQIVWPDPFGHYPWQLEYEPAVCPQPVIGVPGPPVRCRALRGLPGAASRRARRTRHQT